MVYPNLTLFMHLKYTDSAKIILKFKHKSFNHINKSWKKKTVQANYYYSTQTAAIVRSCMLHILENFGWLRLTFGTFMKRNRSLSVWTFLMRDMSRIHFLSVKLIIDLMGKLDSPSMKKCNHFAHQMSDSCFFYEV